MTEPVLHVDDDPARRVAELLAEAAAAGETIVLTGGHSVGQAYEHAASIEPDDTRSATMTSGACSRSTRSRRRMATGEPARNAPTFGAPPATLSTVRQARRSKPASDSNLARNASDGATRAKSPERQSRDAVAVYWRPSQAGRPALALPGASKADAKAARLS